jgi:serine/threonine protein kinase
MFFQLPQPFGRYTLLTKLGTGGMGTVFEAEDPAQRQRVALKIPHDQEDKQALARFQREIALAKRIRHPNLCPIIEDGQISGTFYFTMPLLQGQTLYERKRQVPLWTIAEAVALGRKIALAMHELHRNGTMHRDLKPANIMLRPDGEPIIMDLGLARSISGDDRVTRTGSMMGSPAYMAPEQVEGDPEQMGPASDIFSLGVILYELITGQLPFPGSHPGAIFANLLRCSPKPPSSHKAGLEEVDLLLLKALEKQPQERYGSMAEFAAVLETCLVRQDMKRMQDQEGELRRLKATLVREQQLREDAEKRLRQAQEKITQLQTVADQHRQSRDTVYQKAQTILARMKKLEAQQQQWQERLRQEQQGRTQAEQLVQQATDLVGQLHQKLTGLPKTAVPTIPPATIETQTSDAALAWKPTPAEGVPSLPRLSEPSTPQLLQPPPDDEGVWVLEEEDRPAPPHESGSNRR